jgi:very-short-patch-repair endonuclease
MRRPKKPRSGKSLRGTKLGIPIRRQHPLGNVVVDFYCPRAKFAIELDGAHHHIGEDADRDRQLSARGVVVLRFENFHVRQNLLGVVKGIRELVLSRAALLREPKTSREDEGAEQLKALPDSERGASAPSSLAGRASDVGRRTSRGGGASKPRPSQPA